MSHTWWSTFPWQWRPTSSGTRLCSWVFSLLWLLCLTGVRLVYRQSQALAGTFSWLAHITSIPAAPHHHTPLGSITTRLCSLLQCQSHRLHSSHQGDKALGDQYRAGTKSSQSSTCMSSRDQHIALCRTDVRCVKHDKQFCLHSRTPPRRSDNDITVRPRLQTGNGCKRPTIIPPDGLHDKMLPCKCSSPAVTPIQKVTLVLFYQSLHLHSPRTKLLCCEPYQTHQAIRCLRSGARRLLLPGRTLHLHGSV